MKELSIFVDESGDFGQYSPHSPFYLFSLIFHNQNDSIESNVKKLDNKLTEHGFSIHAIHTGPIIRNEGFYKDYSPEERKKIFNDLLFFAKSVKFKYHIIFVNKKEHIGKSIKSELVNDLSKKLASFVRDHEDYFKAFDKIIVYYDYGQTEITTILTSVFNSLLQNVEFRHVQPQEYKLFQVADLICTLELSKKKFDNNTISTSELNFYENRGRFKDFYYKAIVKKKIQ